MSRPLTATVKAATKKRIFSPRAAIVLTRAATEKIRSLLELHPDAIALRVGVRTRGCNGLSYMLDYATEKGKFDEEVNQNGTRR
jgi:iron-sulfur cluster assembly protein